MSCHTCEADLVDVARGVRLDPDAEARVREHVGRCPSCARRLEREQGVTGELRILKAEAPVSARSAAIEDALLTAFSARHGRDVRRPSPNVAASAARWWLAAAAILVLAAGVWGGSRWWLAVEQSSPGGAPEQARTGDTQPIPTALVDRAGRDVAQGEAARRDDDRRARADEENVMRFVMLPTAAGLPELESGRIVRLDVPMAFLPAYGIDVHPEDAARIVEADVLVGQDGQPRAIRFVGPDSDPRRR